MTSLGSDQIIFRWYSFSPQLWAASCHAAEPCWISFNHKPGSLQGRHVHRDICRADTKVTFTPSHCLIRALHMARKTGRPWPAVLSRVRLIYVVMELLMTSLDVSQSVLSMSALMEDSRVCSVFLQPGCETSRPTTIITMLKTSFAANESNK